MVMIVDEDEIEMIPLPDTVTLSLSGRKIAKITLRELKEESMRVQEEKQKRVEILADGEIESFMRGNREKLIVLERTRAAEQYGLFLVDYNEAEVSITCAGEVINLIEKYWWIHS